MTNRQKVLFIIIILILFIAPFFWHMRIGGDDGKFYYIFPLEFLKNFSNENIYNDLGYFNPTQFLIPFSFILFLSKKILFFLNTQKLFFGLNLACGFLFFYLFLKVLIKDTTKENDDVLARITASLFYSLSIFSYYTLWNTQLLSVYLISIFPLIMLLFFKSVKENKVIYSILGSLILSLSSISILSIPWLLTLIIASLPILIYLLFKNKKVFIKCLVVFSVLLLLLNTYWLVGFLTSIKDNNNPLNHNSATDFQEQNINIIQSVSKNNNILYPFFNLFHKNIQIDYDWPMKDVYLSYLIKLLPLNFIFLLVVILPAFFYKKSSKESQSLYTISIISWLIVLFLFTAKIGKWGIPLFIWLANNIPGFVMFRNMYDKFGTAMSFAYAILLFISLKIIFHKLNIHNVIKNIIYAVLILIILLNAYPFLSGQYYKLPMWNAKNTYDSINDFNDDFYEMTHYISSINTSSKFLWLPLNNAGYNVISDKYNKNYYYSGVSLLKTLTGKNDYTGFLSFNKYSNNTQKYVVNHEYEKLFNLLSKFNIEYIILNKDLTKDIQNSYLYSYSVASEIYTNQMNPKFLNYILGDKIRDFGSRYSIYRINDKYLSKVLDFKNIEFQKINNSRYEVNIKGLKGSQPLIFLSSYNNLWHIYLKQSSDNFICTNKNIYKVYNRQYHEITEKIDDLKRSIDHGNQQLIDQLVEKQSTIEANNITECQQGQNYFLQDLKYLWQKPLFKDSHKIAYDYANEWTLNSDYIINNFDKIYYQENPDGSINIRLTLFFKPQLYFYLGSTVSIITLFACLIYFAFYLIKKYRT